jgi:hypothetical protein
MELLRPLSQEAATLRAFCTGAPAVRLRALVARDVIGQSDGALLVSLSGVDQIFEHPVEETIVLAAVRALLAMP